MGMTLGRGEKEMIRLMITDDCKCWTRSFKRKGISFYLCVIINRLKGYRVEEL